MQVYCHFEAKISSREACLRPLASGIVMQLNSPHAKLKLTQNTDSEWKLTRAVVSDFKFDVFEASILIHFAFVVVCDSV